MKSRVFFYGFLFVVGVSICTSCALDKCPTGYYETSDSDDCIEHRVKFLGEYRGNESDGSGSVPQVVEVEMTEATNVEEFKIEVTGKPILIATVNGKNGIGNQYRYRFTIPSQEINGDTYEGEGYIDTDEQNLRMHITFSPTSDPTAYTKHVYGITKK